jgi:hypothetical protein
LCFGFAQHPGGVLTIKSLLISKARSFIANYSLPIC